MVSPVRIRVPPLNKSCKLQKKKEAWAPLPRPLCNSGRQRANGEGVISDRKYGRKDVEFTVHGPLVTRRLKR